MTQVWNILNQSDFASKLYHWTNWYWLQKQDLVDSQKLWHFALDGRGYPWYVECFSHQIATEDLTMAIAILTLHQKSSRPLRVAHCYDFTFVGTSNSFYCLQIIIVVGTFFVIWQNSFHIPHGFVPTPVFDSQSNFNTLFCPQYIVKLGVLHVGYFVSLVGFWVTCNKNYDCITYLLPRSLTFSSLQYINFDHQSGTFSKQHVSW